MASAAQNYETIEVSRQAGVVRLVLNRPQTRNAMNAPSSERDSDLLASFSEINLSGARRKLAQKVCCRPSPRLHAPPALQDEPGRRWYSPNSAISVSTGAMLHASTSRKQQARSFAPAAPFKGQ